MYPGAHLLPLTLFMPGKQDGKTYFSVRLWMNGERIFCFSFYPKTKLAPGWSVLLNFISSNSKLVPDWWEVLNFGGVILDWPIRGQFWIWRNRKRETSVPLTPALRKVKVPPFHGKRFHGKRMMWSTLDEFVFLFFLFFCFCCFYCFLVFIAFIVLLLFLVSCFSIFFYYFWSFSSFFLFLIST